MNSEKAIIILAIFLICLLLSEIVKTFIVSKKTKTSYFNLIPFYYVYEGFKKKKKKTLN